MYPRTLVASLSLLVASVAVAAPPLFVVKDLGTHAGPDTKLEPGSVGASITDGIVIGYAVTSLEHRNFHAFRSLGGVMSDLGVLVGDEHSIAFGVNAGGQAVGVSYKLGELFSHGVIWAPNGSTTTLGTMEPNDINASGVVAGSTPVSGGLGTSHATCWTAGVAIDLGTLGGLSSMGFGVNDAGWVVGESLLADNKTTHAFVVAGGAMLDLGTPASSNARAMDINGFTVVGIKNSATNIPRATRWSLDAAGAVLVTTDLGVLPGTLNSAAFAVNAAGTIVGNSGDTAFRWANGTMTDLNAEVSSFSGWHFTKATGIDAAGRIVGVGKHFGLQRAFLLVPRAPADLDADGSVNASDLALLLGAWGGTDLAFDLNGDGAVGAEDLAVLLGAWGT